MRIVVVSIFLSVLSLSCSLDSGVDSNACFRTETFFFDNKQLLLKVSNGTTTYSQIDGKGRVFVYAEVNDCSNVVDDGIFESIVFSVPSDVEKFAYENSGLASINCNYDVGGASIKNQSITINKGSVSGEMKEDGTWLVKGNIVVDSTITGIRNKPYNFDAKFTVR